MLLQTNSYIVPRDKRADHARLMRRFRQALSRLGCDTFEVYEQVGANWSTGETNGRFVQIMRFRDRRHQLAVQNAERTDTVAQTLIREFCDMVNFPYQQQQGLFAVGFYNSVLPVAPVRVRTEDEGKEKDHRALPQRPSLGALAGMVGTEEQLSNLTPPQPAEENLETESKPTSSDDEPIAAPIMDAEQDEAVFEPPDLDDSTEVSDDLPPEEAEPEDKSEPEMPADSPAPTPAAEESSPAPQPVSFQAVAEPAASSADPRQIDVASGESGGNGHASEELDLEGDLTPEAEVGQPIWDDSVFAQAIEGDDKSQDAPLSLDANEPAEQEQPVTESESVDATQGEPHPSK